jgi:hypothetical protein
MDGIELTTDVSRFGPRGGIILTSCWWRRVSFLGPSSGEHDNGVLTSLSSATSLPSSTCLGSASHTVNGETIRRVLLHSTRRVTSPKIHGVVRDVSRLQRFTFLRMRLTISIFQEGSTCQGPWRCVHAPAGPCLMG